MTDPQPKETESPIENMVEDIAQEAENADADAATQEQGAPEQPQAEEEINWQERFLRLAAEMDNLRKRTEKEMADARKFAVSNFARDMLNVQDNMDRALMAAKAENADVKTISAGVEMVAQQMVQTLERFQIKKFSSVGEKLDPEKHQAMNEVEDDKADPGTVISEMQTGYLIGDRLLRPALVTVAKKASTNN